MYQRRSRRRLRKRGSSWSILPLYGALHAALWRDSTFSDPGVVAKAASFIPVRVDVDKQREVAEKYGGNARKYGGIGIPNILFLDGKGVKFKQVVGYHGPQKFIAVMDSVLAMR